MRRRKEMRLKDYNYSGSGYYYVTICTHNHLECFGNIVNEAMVLSQFGSIARSVWLDIPNHHPHVQIDEFVVMPNHIHGIIIIDGFVGDRPAYPVNNLSVIIGSFKSTVTKKINRLNMSEFKWQRSFYDHIVRTRESLDKIRQYISSNPARLNDDEDNIINYVEKVQAGQDPT